MPRLSMIHPCYLRERERGRGRERRRMLWYIKRIIWKDQRKRNENTGWQKAKKKRRKV